MLRPSAMGIQHHDGGEPREHRERIPLAGVFGAVPLEDVALGCGLAPEPVTGQTTTSGNDARDDLVMTRP